MKTPETMQTLSVMMTVTYNALPTRNTQQKKNMTKLQPALVAGGEVAKGSLCAFCRKVVPTKPFTNTALCYKMMLESEPTPLAKKGLGVFMMDQKPMSVTTK